MTGTAMNSVMRPDSKRRHTSSASNRGSISQAAPAHSAQHSTFTMPCT
jgi:hypothetical protein